MVQGKPDQRLINPLPPGRDPTLANARRVPPSELGSGGPRHGEGERVAIVILMDPSTRRGARTPAEKGTGSSGSGLGPWEAEGYQIIHDRILHERRRQSEINRPLAGTLHSRLRNSRRGRTGVPAAIMLPGGLS